MTVPDPFAILFAQEMRSLAEEGASFAAEFPEAARHLDLQRLEDRDPYVERFVEGSASLMARIRQAAGAEELEASLLGMFAPDLLQPLPSVSVVRLRARSPLNETVRIPAGAVLRSKPVEESPEGIPFRLLHDVDLQPCDLAQASWSRDEEDRPWLDLVLRWTSKRGRDPWPERIRFHLHADPTVVWALRHGLCRKTESVEVFRDGRWCQAPDLGFSVPVLPDLVTESLESHPLAHARDFLCADHGFRFLDLHGAHRCGIRAPDPLRLRVRLQGVWPRGFSRSVGKEVFQLHCGMVVNRSREALQSVCWDHTGTDRVVRPVGGPHREAIDVSRVEGVGQDPPHRRVVYRPYATRLAKEGEGRYAVVRDATAKGESVVRLGISGTVGDSLLFSQYLSIEGTCCDGDLPRERLAPQDISVPGIGIPPEVALRGLVRPGPRMLPPRGQSARSLLLAAANGHMSGWLDTRRIKDGLRHLVWDPAESKLNLVECIQEVSCWSGRCLEKDVAWRTLEVEFRLRDATCTPESWDRIGILDAFGEVLFRFAQDATEIGARCRMRMLVEPAGIVLDYGHTP